MFKTLFKARHERKNVGVAQRPPGGPAYGYKAPQQQQQQQMQGPNCGQPAFNDPMGPPVSCVQVEYAMSPPTPMGGVYQTQSPMPHGGVEYTQSPPFPDPDSHRQEISKFSTGPAVDYTASAPTMTFESADRNVSMGPAVEYEVSAPIANLRPAPQNAPPGRQQPRYQAYAAPEAPNPNNQGYYNPPVGAYIAELPAQQTYSPRELPVSPVPQRYELANSPRPQPQNTPPSTSTSPSVQNGTWSSASSRSTPGTTPATSPPPPYPPTSAPAIPQAQKQSPSQAQAQGIIKFTVNIFCQRKAEPGMERDEIPRDAREFRLAKVALIPVVAGERRFVSLDVVFGEVDKAIAGLLEKHYLITPDTILTLLPRDEVVSKEKVWKISRLKIAYKGTPSALYLTFRSTEDEAKFQVDFDNVKKISEPA